MVAMLSCRVPFLRARMFTESIAHCDQCCSPRAPSSSRAKVELGQTRARIHSAKPRCAVDLGVLTTEGGCVPTGLHNHPHRAFTQLLGVLPRCCRVSHPHQD